jgi:hypothetical protein
VGHGEASRWTSQEILDDAKTCLLAFHWPEPGEVKDKAKIQWFIDNFGKMDHPG